MNLTGTPAELMAALPHWAHDVVRNARGVITSGKARQSVYPYQAAALAVLADRYDRPGAQILEIGTYYGFTAAVMALSAPQAGIVTLNPVTWEVEAAIANLANLPNTAVFCMASQDYLEAYCGPGFDLIFVDGDHKRVMEDLPWWEYVNPGGLMLFHDFSPSDSARPCPPVYRALSEFGERLGRAPDVSIVDNDKVGMIGWFK